MASTGAAQQWAALAGDIKLSHSVFALPFALLATFTSAAWAGRRPRWIELVLIVACMVLARTTAMAVNRWADADFDARNPRTARRGIPSGRLQRSFVLSAAILCGLLFAATTAGFWLAAGNVWPVVLSPLVLAWLCLYSFTKRWTWLCHLVLGSSLGLSPLAASIAIEPGYLASVEPWLLAGLVLSWVAGFDVIYATQDIDIDRSEGLHSIPSRLGVPAALWISRGLHLLSVAALLAMGASSPHLQTLFDLGVGATVGLLLLEHVLVWRSGSMPMAFMTVNGVISLLLGLLGILDVWRLG